MSGVPAALRQAADMLAPTSDTARLDAEYLLAHALHMSRSDLLLKGASGPVPERFWHLIDRRRQHEPLAYILGSQDFYGRSFHVSPDVLIPRSDSESVVAAALEQPGARGRVLDCGVGSGALLLTILAENPGALGVGIDRSEAALAIARRNAGALGVADRVELLRRDWSENGWREELGRFDCIIANPPYVEDDAELDVSVRGYEPAGALFSGPDGLDDYRRLLPELRHLLAPQGQVVLEIGAMQAKPVAALAGQAGFSSQLRHDLASRPRALVLVVESFAP
ncbi:peptide chain release factor N(5)-glutamine methyltransferase [Altericroceibacterium spongiae]|uniref:Release factor glutamine methyltransferase n=1 Tax=Altericroceibacterium spongiae TaxID=2320269 RepID=A0A420ELL8_9SPHN|nr:peptide chain release factor N(5)-glutamine methyltransferase [Altericroceibacterium spongiae]RKF21595.1 peptide chain release factor N(5)-glutamine methyltransferase [Altericroceibacterium spongiae]